MPQRHAGRRTKARLNKRVHAKKIARFANRIKEHAKKMSK